MTRSDTSLPGRDEAFLLDPLTGLGNHHAFTARLAQEAARFSRYGTDLSLVLFGLDRASDLDVRRFGDVLADRTRRSDAAYRIDPDVFALLMPETQPEEARKGALRLVDVMHDASPETRVSWGAAFAESPDPASVVDVARAALYVARRSATLAPPSEAV